MMYSYRCDSLNKFLIVLSCNNRVFIKYYYIKNTNKLYILVRSTRYSNKYLCILIIIIL